MHTTFAVDLKVLYNTRVNHTTLKESSMSTDSQQSPASSPLSTGDNTMAQLLDEYMPACRIERGKIVRGTIVRIEPVVIVVDVGAKCEGTVTGRELESIDPERIASLSPGDEIPVYVLHPEGSSGEVVLSLTRAVQEEDWLQAEDLLKCQGIIELEVVDANRGGLLVRLGKIRGFVPASQLTPSRGIPRISDPSCTDALKTIVNCSLKLKVIEANRERNRLILSERAALFIQREDEEKEFLTSLQQGEVKKGKISNLTDFGAFVNLGGLDGLLHLSEISWYPVEHPAHVFEIGQEIEVMILNINHERRQVALSTKRLEPDPWTMVGERYEEGQLVEGRITRLTKWGAFARLVNDEAIEGLIHISELDEGRVVHPRDVVKPGQVTTLRIVRMEPERRRLGLSIKQVAGGDQDGEDWKADYAASAQPPMESPMASAFDEAVKG